MTRLEQKRTGWLEPMREWIKEVENLPKITQESNLFAKKVAYRTLFGSNLVLDDREARVSSPSGLENKPKNQWAAPQKAEKFCRGAGGENRTPDLCLEGRYYTT